MMADLPGHVVNDRGEVSGSVKTDGLETLVIGLHHPLDAAAVRVLRVAVLQAKPFEMKKICVEKAAQPSQNKGFQASRAKRAWDKLTLGCFQSNVFAKKLLGGNTENNLNLCKYRNDKNRASQRENKQTCLGRGGNVVASPGKLQE